MKSGNSFTDLMFKKKRHQLNETIRLTKNLKNFVTGDYIHSNARTYKRWSLVSLALSVSSLSHQPVLYIYIHVAKMAGCVIWVGTLLARLPFCAWGTSRKAGPMINKA